MGENPAETVEALTERALADVAVAGDPLITVIGGLGIRLHTYLPTRIFELAVHSLDIARATGIEFRLPAEVLDAAVTLGARTAVTLGQGEAVLTAMTGSSELPPSFRWCSDEIRRRMGARGRHTITLSTVSSQLRGDLSDSDNVALQRPHLTGRTLKTACREYR